MKRLSLPTCLLLLIYPPLLSGQADTSPQDVSFIADCDRTTQRYVIVLPADFKNDHPHNLLIALHGHGSDRWQFVKSPRDECRAARDIAAKHHLIFVSPDYRAKTSWMGPKAEADLLQIIRDLKKQYKIQKTFLTGGSMGGTACLTFAALHPDLVDAVASMNGTANLLEYENFQDAIRQSFGGTKSDIPLEYKNRSAEYWPERLTMPIGLATGGKDQSVPPQSTLRLAAILKKLDRPLLLIHRPNQGHATNYNDATKILEFIIYQTPSSTKPQPQSRR